MRTCEDTYNGRDAAAEIERLHGVVSQANRRCDHLGMRLGEVIRERDALRARREQDMRAAYDAGWCTAATWMERDDLIADVDSPAFLADRAAAIGV